MIKKEKIIDVNINNANNYYINTSIREELKAIQRSIAMLRQDLPKIVHDEIIKSITKG